MIFVGGVHGVGKTTFCGMVNSYLGIAAFTASALIAGRRAAAFCQDRLASDIESNQEHLREAVQELNEVDRIYLLDGHFCLLDADGRVARVPRETFIALQPQAILVLADEPQAIAERRRLRDGVDHPVGDISRLQAEELSYAAEIASLLGVPIKVHCDAGDLIDGLDFVQENIRRIKNGR